MKIIKKGKPIIEDQHYLVGQQFTCQTCQCVFLFEAEDLKKILWMSVRNPKKVACPDCGRLVVVDGAYYASATNKTINRSKWIEDSKFLLTEEQQPHWDAELTKYARELVDKDVHPVSDELGHSIPGV